MKNHDTQVDIIAKADLGGADVLGELALVLLLALADAEHAVHAVIEDLEHLAVDGEVVILEDNTSLTACRQQSGMQEMS